MENRTHRKQFERILATISEYDLPVLVGTYGTRCICIESDLNSWSIQKLQKEFDMVHFLDGKLVVSD